jgi:tetratricopeptide (TPR) repeat protein
LVKDALNYLDSLAGEAHGDPELQRELAAAYERVGNVRGGESSGSLGDIPGARESYAKALNIREALIALNPADARARRDCASSHQKIGYLLMETDEASIGLEHLRKALAIYQDLTREQPTKDDLQLELVDTSNKLGQALRQRGDLAGALEQSRAALAICEKLVASNPRDQRYRRALWAGHALAATMFWFHDDTAGAIEASKKALSLGEALIAEDPLNADYRRALVLDYQRGGDYRRYTDKAVALELFRKAAALDEEMLVADPANALTRKDLGFTHKRIADFVANQEDWSQALLYFNKALETYQKVVTDAPADLVSHLLVATCRAGIAAMHARLGEIDRALQECAQATALLEQIREDPTHARQRYNRAQAYEYLGYAYVAMAESPKASVEESRQRRSAARDSFRQALNVLDDLRSRGKTGVPEEGWAKLIAGQIAKCDTALEKYADDASPR